MRSLSITLSLALSAVAHSATPMQLPVTPEVSNDGSKIVFSWNDDLWMCSSAGGQAQRLTSHPGREVYPKFSPDNKSIYFNSDRSGSLQIWKLDVANGGTPAQITQHSESSLLEDVSADGNKLLYRGLRDYPGRNPMRLYSIDSEGKEAEKLVVDAYATGGKISPDGNQILLTREGVETYRQGYNGSQASQIWLYDLTNKTFTQPVSNTYGCRTPIWKPDGSGFYYLDGTTGTFNLASFDFESKQKQLLTEFTEDGIFTPVISDDGSTLVYRRLFDYYRLDLNSANPAEKISLSHNEDLPTVNEKDITIAKTNDADFSESGLEIVFTANGDLYAMDTILREPNQLTNTFAREGNTYFAEKGQAILFIEDDGVNTTLCKLTKDNPTKFWWEAEKVTKHVIVKSDTTIENFGISPDGEKLVYTTKDGKLWLANNDGSEPRVLVSSWDTPSFDWSPDSKWLTYAYQDNDFNSDIYIMPIDGSQAAVNISQHPDNDYSPRFSPDGKKIAFAGRRFGNEIDLFFVDLTSVGSTKSARAKKLEQARKAMQKDPAYKPKKKENKPAKEKADEDKTDKKKQEPAKPQAANAKQPKADEPAKTEQASSPKTQAQPTAKPKPAAKAEKPSEDELSYDLVGIQKRIQRIKIPAGTPSRLIWSHDSAKIIFQSNGKSTFAVAAKANAKPAEFIKAAGTPIRMSKSGKLFWLSNGSPAVASGGKSTEYKFQIYSHQRRQDYQRTLFRHIWRTMRDGFYDEQMNQKNWDGILTKYEDTAANSVSMQSFNRVAAMLLGELNASHTGYRGAAWHATRKAKPAWKAEVVHLGVRFDDSHSGDGWKIKEVYPTGPADQQRSQLRQGEIILSINGTAVTPATAKHTVLTGRISDAVELKVLSLDGEKRNVTLQPTTYHAARLLVSNLQIEKNRQQVEKISKGRMGYIHVARMMWDEFQQFERHLYENGAGKDGIIIDVRDNGGGFTTDHLLTALTQPRHSYTIPRNGGPGYPQDRFVYATWNKPIVVLCNQNSFSNAEIFAHAIRNLNRGKVVGIQTAGGVISTGSMNILGSGNLRYPFRGWFVADSGLDMELNGAMPHHSLWPQPGEIPAGIDVQIEKAVDVLGEEIESNKQRYPKAQYHNRR